MTHRVNQPAVLDHTELCHERVSDHPLADPQPNSLQHGMLGARGNMSDYSLHTMVAAGEATQLMQATRVHTIVVRETRMMVEHSSNHNEITGEEAIFRLKHSGHPHCYLTRYSQSKNKYVLTVYKKDRPKDVEEHFPLIIENERRKIEGKEKDFASLADLVHYYERERINPSLPNIGHNHTLVEYSGRQATLGGNMMGPHNSYHNVITKEEAMRRLRHSSLPHCYLTYFNSESQTYMLAVYLRQRHDRVEKHFPIIISHGLHQLEGAFDNQDSYESIAKLLQHYGTHRVDPSLVNIGQNYSFEVYDQRRRCVIA